MPKVVDHDVRRSEIATAVLQVIARSGVSGASLRSVAQEAGCSTGVIAHYFGDKEALLIGTLREAMQRQGKMIADAVAELNGMARLQAVLEAGMTLDSARKAICRIFYHYAGEGMNEPALRQELSNYYVWWRREVADIIEALQSDGHFAGQDITKLARTFVGLAEGLAIQGIFSDNTINADVQRELLAISISGFDRALVSEGANT